MSTTAIVPAAESAPVVETGETLEVSVQERLDHATSKELDTWRKTGDIPAIKIKPAESKAEISDSKAASSTAPEKKDEKKPAETGASHTPPADAAASQTATQPQRRNKTDARFEKLLDAWEKDRTELARLRSERPATAEKQTSQAATDDKTEAKPEAKLAAKPKLTDNDPKTGKPFASLQDWSDAVDDWNDKRLEAKLSERLGAVEQTRTQSEQERAAAEEIVAKSRPAMEKYPDFMQVAANPDLPIPPGSVVDQFVRDSDDPGELAYYIGKHPDVLEEFYGFKFDADTKRWDYKDWPRGKSDGYSNLISPIRQVKRLEAIERELSAKPAEKKEPAAEARPAKTAPPKLPPPPPELSGRGATVGDDAEKALARGDTAAYMRIVNQRELAASRR